MGYRSNPCFVILPTDDLLPVLALAAERNPRSDESGGLRVDVQRQLSEGRQQDGRCGSNCRHGILPAAEPTTARIIAD
jgi:hypothetical protein